MIDKAEYREYVGKSAPKSPMFRSLAAAFLVGGLICCVGQAVGDVMKVLFPDMSADDVGSWTTVVMIFFGTTNSVISPAEVRSSPSPDLPIPSYRPRSNTTGRACSSAYAPKCS